MNRLSTGRCTAAAMSLAVLVSTNPALAQSAPAQTEPVQSAPVASAKAVTDRARGVLAVLNGTRPAAEVFAPSFLAAVPASQLTGLIAELSAEHGKLAGIDEVKVLDPVTAQFLLRFERARATALMQVEPITPYRVIGLRLTAITPLDDGPAKLLADFKALGPQTSFALFQLDGDMVKPVLTHQPARQMAIGSTFKLWVLEAVAAEVAAGRLQWDQVVRLGQRSVPSGITQDWPERAPVTVETLVTLMISRSDNTATDTLMRLVGRDTLATRVRALGHSDPSRMLPMLTTLEAFSLKADPAGRGPAYAAADDIGQAALLRQIAPELSPAKLAGGLPTGDHPAAIDTIEWFASTEDIAGVLNALRQRRDPRVMAILGVNSGLEPDLSNRFGTVGYKGGSEPGVISMSYVLQDKAGHWYAATGSWNDPAKAVDELRFQQLMQRLVAQIR